MPAAKAAPTSVRAVVAAREAWADLEDIGAEHSGFWASMLVVRRFSRRGFSSLLPFAPKIEPATEHYERDDEKNA